MDLRSPVHHSDNESISDVLELDTDYDFDKIEEEPTNTTVNHKMGSIWRDIVVGEQMEGCLTRLEVTTKAAAYTDMDDPNYEHKNSGPKRKRDFLSTKSNKKTENILESGEYDLESDHVVKKRYSHGNGDFKKCNYKYGNTKGFVEKRTYNDNTSRCRILPDICDPEEKTNDQFLDELCTNLHEHNKILMLSVLSKIDRKIILEKYKKTCLIEANGGQMIKNGNRRRTSGGIFFNLIKEDKSIPNSAKKDLFSCPQNEEIKKKKKREKMKRKKEKLRKLLAKDLTKKEDVLKTLNEELETLPSNCTIENEELSD
ncbi:phosphorylated adapter RNA export protein isoform X2 [Rhopalosiphum maidis]|uniref:phosphorylated adapter RNA export protein isoform X2 n=1 Tax=Rhopalosiphum maidis TaxID=43146 RepID=UPI000EFE9E61|nr:phosphorylated adapter RNA export protein isoform X2 [Rhopalosiphum maidis]